MRADLPVEWLTWLLYGIEAYRPKGASPVTGRAGSLMAVTASWASGAYARPGRFFSASALDCAERTIERHWRIIEGLGLAVVTVRGQWLSAERRREVLARPDETDRWRDRQEWTLTTPAWAAEVAADPEVQDVLDRCRAAAIELLRELTRVVEHRTRRAASPGRTGPTSAAARCGARGALTRPRLARPVDNRPTGLLGPSFRVAPSAVGLGSNYSSSLRVVLRPKGRKKPLLKGATSSHSPTRSGSRGRRAGSRPEVPRAAAVLARALLTRGRLPWLVRSPRYMLEATVRRFALAGWTPQDVECAAQNRLKELGYSPPQRVERPASYLAWLLNSADISMPPAQARTADELRRKDERHAEVAVARHAAAAREAAATEARGGAGHQAARAALAGISRRGTRRPADDPIQAAVARAQARDAARAGYPEQPGIDEIHHDRECAGCRTLSPEVLVRTALPRPTPLCPSCWDTMRHLWT